MLWSQTKEYFKKSDYTECIMKTHTEVKSNIQKMRTVVAL